jgi:hypothetical protein
VGAGSSEAGRFQALDRRLIDDRRVLRASEPSDLVAIEPGDAPLELRTLESRVDLLCEEIIRELGEQPVQQGDDHDCAGSDENRRTLANDADASVTGDTYLSFGRLAFLLSPTKTTPHHPTPTGGLF